MGKAEGFPISAVIPAYNGAGMVELAIKAALEQTKPPAEIVVVDDGSTDDTAERVHSFGEAVRYIYQENGGEAAARNRCVREAQSPWVAFVDQDDRWDGGHLERMASAILATEGAASFYFSDTLLRPIIGGDRLWEKVGFTIEGAFKLIQDGTDWVLIEPRMPIMLQSSAIHRERFLQSGGFLREVYGRNDTYIFLKLGLGSPVCAVAGLGGMMNPDVLPEQRITTSFKGDKWARMRVVLYHDLLANGPKVPEKTRHILQARLADAKWNCAKHAWQKHHYRDFLTEGIGSLRQAPVHMVQHTRGRRRRSHLG